MAYGLYFALGGAKGVFCPEDNWPVTSPIVRPSNYFLKTRFLAGMLFFFQESDVLH